MTSEEFGKFVLEINATFRGEKIGPASDDDAEGAARGAAYQLHLGAMDYADAQAAIRLLVQDGQVFVPAPAEVIAATRRVSQPAVASWLEAWPVIQRHITRRRGRSVNDTLWAINDDIGEIPARFVKHYGVDRLALEEVDDADHGGAVRRRLEQAYDRFVEDYLDGVRVHAALEPGSGPRRLDLARLRLERGA